MFAPRGYLLAIFTYATLDNAMAYVHSLRKPATLFRRNPNLGQNLFDTAAWLTRHNLGPNLLFKPLSFG